VKHPDNTQNPEKAKEKSKVARTPDYVSYASVGTMFAVPLSWTMGGSCSVIVLPTNNHQSIIIVNWPQKVAKRHVRDARPVPPPYYVRGTEVNSLVDPDVDHIVRHIRKALIRFRLVDESARNRESHFVPEEALERTGHGACKALCARGQSV
jgi:hypothetical protein